MAIDLTAPVLIVDDQEMMVHLARKYLVRLGFRHVDQAENGQEALAMIRKGHHPLVIADLYMEPLSGLELLRTIRQDRALKNIRFLLMTGSVQSAALVAEMGGADAYIVKPFTQDELKAKLERMFGQRFPVESPEDGPAETARRA